MSELDPIARDKAQANADLEDILALKKHPAFARYFLRRLQEKAEPLERALLHDRMSLEDYRDKQTHLSALREISGMLTQDEIGNRSIAGRSQG